MNTSTSIKDFVLIAQNAFINSERVFKIKFEQVVGFQPNSVNINGQMTTASTPEHGLNIRGRVKFKLENIHNFSALNGDINFMLQQAVHEKVRFCTYFDVSNNMCINLNTGVIYVDFSIYISSGSQLNEIVKTMLYDIVDDTLLS